MAQTDLHELSEEMDIAFEPEAAGEFELARMRHSTASFDG